MNINDLNPYRLWIKAGAAALLFIVVFGWGCVEQKKRDAGNLQAMKGQRDAANAALVVVNDETKAKEAAATAAAKRARDAAERSAEAAKALSVEIAGIKSDIDAAKRDPKCKQSLEAKVCARLL